MTGLLKLSDHILCKKEVLGKVYECEIAGISFKIHFPQYPVIDETNPAFGFSTPLLPPKIGANWKRGEDNLFWGYPMSYPAGNSCVEHLALSVECTKEILSKYACTLYESIPIWEHAFIDHIKLETKQGIERDENNRRSLCNLELMEGKYIENISSTELFLYVPKDDSFASENNIINAISFANSGKELLPEYQMLLSAYEARRLNQNRRAIMDACSAMELALVNQINLFCQSIGLSSKILTDKYKYLKEIIELVKKISKSFPSDNYENLVIKPRNAIMHNRDLFPSDDTTEKLIACVERFLCNYHYAYY